MASGDKDTVGVNSTEPGLASGILQHESAVQRRNHRQVGT
jgi:hypothetical protein